MWKPTSTGNNIFVCKDRQKADDFLYPRLKKRLEIRQEIKELGTKIGF